MLKKLLFSLTIVLFFSCSSASAQYAYSPAKDSLERKVILSVLRVPVERALKQKIRFAVEHFKIQGNWAFLHGEPQNPAGGRPNYKGTEYREAIDADAFDNNFFALLKKTGGKWKVVTYEIGCTDVCYLPWTKDYKAPKAIFPYTE